MNKEQNKILLNAHMRVKHKNYEAKAVDAKPHKKDDRFQKSFDDENCHRVHIPEIITQKLKKKALKEWLGEFKNENVGKVSRSKCNLLF